MINHAEWFSSRLSSSVQEIAWTLDQIPVERQQRKPPTQLGDWSAARHLFHIMYYEETLALPGMRQWWGDPMPQVADSDEENAWSGSEPVQEMLPRIMAIREQQIFLISKIADADWQRASQTIWGPVTLFWVVAKTYQHTAEHISDLLRIALFWDVFAAREE